MNTKGLMPAQADFMKRVYDAAKRVEAETNIPAEVVTAQAILESNWGKAAIGNNVFGIKAGVTWPGKKQLKTTHEWQNGKWVKVEAYFRDYASLEDALKDHAKFLHGNRYRWAYSKPHFRRDQVLLETACKQFPDADDQRRFAAIQAIPREDEGKTPYWHHFAQRIHEAGYATDYTYSTQLIGIIKKRLV